MPIVHLYVVKQYCRRNVRPSCLRVSPKNIAGTYTVVDHTEGMRQLRFTLAITWMLLGTVVYGQTHSNSVDETAIREIVQKYMDARNSRNAEAVRALFTTDADQLVSTGEWRRGIDALMQGAMASSQKETGKSSISLEAIRFVDPDVALADGRYQTSAASTGAVRNMRTTLIIKRTDAGWRIAAIRNMLPVPNTSNTPR